MDNQNDRTMERKRRMLAASILTELTRGEMLVVADDCTQDGPKSPLKSSGPRPRPETSPPWLAPSRSTIPARGWKARPSENRPVVQGSGPRGGSVLQVP